MGEREGEGEREREREKKERDGERGVRVATLMAVRVSNCFLHDIRGLIIAYKMQ